MITNVLPPILWFTTYMDKTNYVQMLDKCYVRCWKVCNIQECKLQIHIKEWTLEYRSLRLMIYRVLHNFGKCCKVHGTTESTAWCEMPQRDHYIRFTKVSFSKYTVDWAVLHNIPLFPQKIVGTTAHSRLSTRPFYNKLHKQATLLYKIINKLMPRQTVISYTGRVNNPLVYIINHKKLIITEKNWLFWCHSWLSC